MAALSLTAVCVRVSEEEMRKREMWTRERRGCVEWREEKKEKQEEKKEEWGRESEWDTCPIMGGWEKMMLSSPNQSNGDM
jgi:hypothetical protein